MLASSLISIRASAAPNEAHNVILFVADGLRGRMVDSTTAPAMAALRDTGVYFRHGHSVLPTFTTTNASAMATGHYPGDTGDFSNVIYTGFAVGQSVTPFLEDDRVLGDVDRHFAGDYLNEETLLAAARDAGYGTAAIGKLGPVLIFDHTDRTGDGTIALDDSTGSPAGIPLSTAVADALKAAGLPLAPPPRGDNAKPGSAAVPGTTVANVVQQDYFVDAAVQVVLPLLRARGRPFVMVFWSRDPDGTQHAQGDSLNQLVPGINGPTSLAAIRNADDDLAKLRAALSRLGLADTTDVFVTADHGFSTISKQSQTSRAARAHYAGVPPGFLPPGFLAIDVAAALRLPLFDADANGAAVPPGQHPTRGNGLIGRDPDRPDVIVAANGGSDLIYLPKHDRKTAARVLRALLEQDYVSGIFADDTLGPFSGTLPLSAINLAGSAVTPRPAFAVNFRSFSTGCNEPTNCTAEVADTSLQQGQGMHGSFSAADTLIFMAASGPDFKTGFVDETPASNADVGRTLAQILRLTLPTKGGLRGRVLEEAMPGGSTPQTVVKILRSAPGASGLRTVLDYQLVGGTRYFDAAGFPGRTVGLAETRGGVSR